MKRGESVQGRKRGLRSKTEFRNSTHAKKRVIDTGERVLQRQSEQGCTGKDSWEGGKKGFWNGTEA